MCMIIKDLTNDKMSDATKLMKRIQVLDFRGYGLKIRQIASFLGSKIASKHLKSLPTRDVIENKLFRRR
jgi:hypothetical protein